MDDNYSGGVPQTETDALGEELRAVNEIVRLMQQLGPSSRTKVFRIVQTFLGIAPEPTRQPPPSRMEAGGGITSVGKLEGTFSEDRSLSPKEFMMQKRPMQDIERIAALAYYLTHYRNTPNFKNIDLSSLNTEAAQIKFSNPAQAVANAIQSGLLIPAAHGAKQISAGGELFVQALPDRDAAKAAMAQFRKRRKTRRGVKAGGEGDLGESDE
jgi:hypothetical protein